jgi:hypothetical protein
MSTRFFRVVVLLVALFSLTTLHAQQAPPADGPGGAQGGPGGRGGGSGQNAAQMISMLKPNLYLFTDGGANSVARVTNEGILLINAKGLAGMNYDDLLAQIKTFPISR